MGQVLDGRREAKRRQLTPGLGVALLGLVPEGEERLLAARLGAGARDPKHLLGREVGPLAGTRTVGEGAVAAVVPAQLGERDKDLARVGDAGTEGPVPDLGRGPHGQPRIRVRGPRQLVQVLASRACGDHRVYQSFVPPSDCVEEQYTLESFGRDAHPAVRIVLPDQTRQFVSEIR